MGPVYKSVCVPYEYDGQCLRQLIRWSTKRKPHFEEYSPDLYIKGVHNTVACAMMT